MRLTFREVTQNVLDFDLSALDCVGSCQIRKVDSRVGGFFFYDENADMHGTFRWSA